MNEPSTIVDMKGSPNRRKGCFWRALRYRAARELGSVAAKEREGREGIVEVGYACALSYGLGEPSNRRCKASGLYITIWWSTWVDGGQMLDPADGGLAASRDLAISRFCADA